MRCTHKEKLPFPLNALNVNARADMMLILGSEMTRTMMAVIIVVVELCFSSRATWTISGLQTVK